MDKVFIDQIINGEHEEAHVTLSRHWKSFIRTVFTEYNRLFALDIGLLGKNVSICSMAVAFKRLIFVTYADKTVLFNRGYTTTKLMRKALGLIRKTLERPAHELELSAGWRKEISSVLRKEITVREASYTFLLCHRRSRKHPQIEFDSTLPLPNELAQEIAKRILY